MRRLDAPSFAPAGGATARLAAPVSTPEPSAAAPADSAQLSAAPAPAAAPPAAAPKAERPLSAEQEAMREGIQRQEARGEKLLVQAQGLVAQGSNTGNNPTHLVMLGDALEDHMALHSNALSQQKAQEKAAAARAQPLGGMLWSVAGGVIPMALTTGVAAGFLGMPMLPLMPMLGASMLTLPVLQKMMPGKEGDVWANAIFGTTQSAPRQEPGLGS